MLVWRFDSFAHLYVSEGQMEQDSSLLITYLLRFYFIFLKACRGSHHDDAHGSVHRDFDAKLATLFDGHSVTVSVIGRTDSAASTPSMVLRHHHGTVHGRARVSQAG